ncbi:MAG: plasmid pRiA4b ORF-3 family protein [Candidatus Edwardsbacteria bacterium]
MNRPKSLKKQIYDLLKTSQNALSIEEIILGLEKVTSIKKTKQQIRNALSAYDCKEIIRVGKETYNLLSHMVNGIYYRYTLSEQEILNGILSCDDELGFIFDPYENRRKRQIKIFKDNTLITETKLEFCGPFGSPRLRITGLSEWIRKEKLSTDDDIIIEVVDIDSGLYKFIPEKKFQRNEEVIQKKNKEVTEIIIGILNRIDRKSCWPKELTKRVTGLYSYRDNCPPDNLTKIVEKDERLKINEVKIPLENAPPIREICIAEKVHTAGSCKIDKKDFCKVYQFKITLDGIKPPIWRRIQVPETYNFWELHVAIQDAMGWYDCHLHEFNIEHPETGEEIAIGIPDEEGWDYKKLLTDWEENIANYFSLENKRAKYTYDFGDNWEHTIELEKILVREKDKKYPVCMDGKRACPPEDVGSIPGYEEFIEIIKDPEHEQYEEMLKWVGGKFDPEHFNPKEIVFDDPKVRFKYAFEDK